MRLQRRRRGFTLLEMILAMAIGLVLLGGVYMALSLQLGQAHSGREATQEATLVRSILSQMTADILCSLGPYDPKQAPPPSSAPSDSTSDEPNASSADMPPAGATVLFNVGVQGDSGMLLLSVGRGPAELLAPGARRLGDDALPKVADLRRITYWVPEGRGLMRQELTAATSSDIDTTTPDADKAQEYSPEVRSITFQFWDGGSWVATWDSSALGPDGETPVGSPAAIEITLEITPRDEGQTPKKHRHVVQLPTGNNYSSQTP